MERENNTLRNDKKSPTFFDIPQKELVYRAIKLFILGSLAWDYADSVLDMAAQRKMGGHFKKVSREIRALRRDYDSLRGQDLDEHHLQIEQRCVEQFEDINKSNIRKLCYGLLNEIRRQGNLDRDDELFVEAVQMAMTVLDALLMYAEQCDKFIRTYYPAAPHSMLNDHFRRLHELLPVYVKDYCNPDSQSRFISARILLNEINKIELYGD